MPTQPLPSALRATAGVKKSPLSRRRRRVLQFDAQYSGGHIELNVDADKILQGARYPADAHATRMAAERACPAVGTGPWVEYATGRPVGEHPYDADVEALLKQVESAIAILERAGGEAHWINWLRADHDRIRARDAYGLEHLLRAFGGMASFNDVVLHSVNGNRGTEEELRSANDLLTRCRSMIYQRASALLGEQRRP